MTKFPPDDCNNDNYADGGNDDDAFDEDNDDQNDNDHDDDEVSPLLNTLSLLAEEAGTVRTFFATFDKIGSTVS